MPRIFVYGSMRRGKPAHALLGGAPFVGPQIVYGYALTVTPRGHVAMRPYCSPHTQVSGEVYEVPDSLLLALDAHEGGEYAREYLPDYSVYAMLCAQYSFM